MEEENKNIEEPVVENNATESVQKPVAEPAPAVEPQPVVEETPVEQAPVPVSPEPVTVAPTELPKIEEEQKEEPKKKSKLPIILLLLILLAAGGFAVWYFVLGGNGSKKESGSKEETSQKEEKKDDKKEDEKEDEKEEEKEEEKEKPKEEEKEEALSNEDVKKVDTIVTELTGLLSGYFRDGITKLDNQKLLGFALAKVSNGKFNNFPQINKSEVEKVVKQYFGDLYSINHEDYMLKSTSANNDVPIYTYADEIYTFNTDVPAVEMTRSFATGYPKYVTGTKKGNSVVVDYKIGYRGYCPDVCGPTDKYYDVSVNQTDPVIVIDQNEILSSPKPYDEVYEQIKDKLSTTRFTFEIVDGYYTLKSIKVI